MHSERVRSRILIAIGVAMVGVIVAVLGGIFIWNLLRATDDPGEREVPAAEVVQALELLESDPAALLPPELRDELEPQIAAAFPEGTRVEADPDTWEQSSTGGGVIRLSLTMPDGITEEYWAIMAEYDDGWRILQTVEVAP